MGQEALISNDMMNEWRSQYGHPPARASNQARVEKMDARSADLASFFVFSAIRGILAAYLPCERSLWIRLKRQ
jgi:hypothetical protein